MSLIKFVAYIWECMFYGISIEASSTLNGLAINFWQYSKQIEVYQIVFWDFEKLNLMIYCLHLGAQVFRKIFKSM